METPAHPSDQAHPDPGAASNDMEAGTQPLDSILSDRGLTNADLVAASPSQLTHKVVGKARRGRRITAKAQLKVLDALNRTGTDGAPFSVGQLFNYRGR